MELSKNQVRLKAARKPAKATSLIWRAYWSKCVLVQITNRRVQYEPGLRF
jgi:hypothetical protein